MAINLKLNVTRNQLATFIKDHETLKQFEKLISYMNTLIPADNSDTAITANTAENKSNENANEIYEFKKDIDNILQDKQQHNIDEIYELKKQLEEILQNIRSSQNNSLVADYFDFTASNSTAHRVGRLCWNIIEDTLNIHHPGGVLQQVGQEQYIRFENLTGSDIPNGTMMGLEVIAGIVTGNIVPYIADGSIPLVYVVGVTTQDIISTEWGRLTTFGQVKDFDTTGATFGETWILGDILYASPVVAGGFTNIKPTAPNWCIPIALVQNVDAINGIVFVRPTIEQALYYGTFSLNTDISPSAINTAYTIVFDTTDSTNGVILGTPLSRVIVPQSGVYSLDVLFHLESTSASAKLFWGFFRVNGIDIPRSATTSAIVGSGAHVSLNRNYTVVLKKGDYIEVGYAADSIAVIINNDIATAFAPASPACTLSVEQIQH